MASETRIGCFWRGGPLSFLQMLSLVSFRNAEHEVAVYAYQPMDDLPQGVEWRDAAEILPLAEITALGLDPALNADLVRDLFRYRLLAREDGVIWAEPDFCLLEPLTTEDGYLFGWQSRRYVGADILALPKESPALNALVEFTGDPHPIPPWLPEAEAAELSRLAAEGEPTPVAALPWGVWGAPALTHFLTEAGEVERARPDTAFYALPFVERAFLLTRKQRIKAVASRGATAIPLYGADLTRLILKNEGGLPKYWCPLGELMREHEIDPREAPLPGSGELPADRWVSDYKKAPTPTPVDEVPATVAAASPPKAQAAPASAKKAASQDDEPSVLIVTTMKNEGPFILEWIAYHRSIGIKNFVVYTNDCDDGTVELLDLLAEKGLITARIDNPFKTGSKANDWQRAALWDVQTSPPARSADWIIPMDVDEFINIHVGSGRFLDLINAVPDANMISMVWRLFGNGFQSEFRDKFITESMTWCAHENCNKPHQAWGFKTAFKDIGAYKHFSVHRPQRLFEEFADEIRWYSSAGRQLPERFKKAGWRVGKPEAGYDLVTLNHYSIRSSESYLVKRQRGRVNHVDRDQGMAYWFRMNHNAQQDFSIANKLPAAKVEFQRLMDDSDIAATHRCCVAAHSQRIAELRAQPEYAALFDEVESRRIKNLSRILYRFGNAIFGVGPDAVPPEILKWADSASVVDRVPAEFGEYQNDPA